MKTKKTKEAAIKRQRSPNGVNCALLVSAWRTEPVKVYSLEPGNAGYSDCAACGVKHSLVGMLLEREGIANNSRTIGRKGTESACPRNTKDFWPDTALPTLIV